MKSFEMKFLMKYNKTSTLGEWLDFMTSQILKSH